MPDLRRRVRRPKGLAVIFAEANHARLHAGLSLACAAAAMDRPVRLFFHGESVCALQQGRRWGGDTPYEAAGLATLAGLIAQTQELGVAIMACPTGLHLCGLDAANLDERIETGGLIAFMAMAKTDELLLA